MWMFLLTIFWFATSVVSIRHGFSVAKGTYPWAVSLQVRSLRNFQTPTNWRHVCGGTIVDNSVVYTAAHCIKILERYDTIYNITKLHTIRIVANEYNIYNNDSMEQVRYIKKMIYEEGYQARVDGATLEMVIRVGLDPGKLKYLSAKENKDMGDSFARAVEKDHAAIIISEAFAFGESVQKIKPVTGNNFTTEKCHVTAWGNTGDYNNGLPQRALVDQLVPFGVKAAALNVTFNSPKENTQTTMCNGDSGSGLVCEGANGEKMLMGAFSTFLYKYVENPEERCRTALPYSFVTNLHAAPAFIRKRISRKDPS